MNGHGGYVNAVSPAPMKSALGSQELNFRWPHLTAANSMPEKDHSPRVDGRYTAIRNPGDVRSRYDASSMLHDEQQRLHALYMDQFYKGANSDNMRSGGHVGSNDDIRFPIYESRQQYPKKNGDDGGTYEEKSSFQDQHYQQESKVIYTDGEGRYFQNGYTNNTNFAPSSKLSTNETKRYSSDNVDVTNASMVTGSIPSPQNISQKISEPLNGNLNIFSENVNNLSYIKEESITKRVNATNADILLKSKKENFDNLLSVNTNSPENEQTMNNEKLSNSGSVGGGGVDSRKDFSDAKIKVEKEQIKSPLDKNSESTDNGLPSYTAMIAQAILKKSSKSTLSDIYEYMEKTFPSLEKRGTGWRNCVRHTLSLNDCFLKLHRPENGRSCNWTIHPSYYESFSRGDYRKKRALRKRTRGIQWMDPLIFNGYSLLREHEIHNDMNQQQHSMFHHSVQPSAGGGGGGGMWNTQNGYNCSIVQNSPDHLHHFPSHQPPSHPPPSPSGNIETPPYSTHMNQHGHHFESSNCTYPDCYCQYNRNSCRVYSI